MDVTSALDKRRKDKGSKGDGRGHLDVMSWQPSKSLGAKLCIGQVWPRVTGPAVWGSGAMLKVASTHTATGTWISEVGP